MSRAVCAQVRCRTRGSIRDSNISLRHRSYMPVSPLGLPIAKLAPSTRRRRGRGVWPRVGRGCEGKEGGKGEREARGGLVPTYLPSFMVEVACCSRQNVARSPYSPRPRVTALPRPPPFPLGRKEQVAREGSGVEEGLNSETVCWPGVTGGPLLQCKNERSGSRGLNKIAPATPRCNGGEGWERGAEMGVGWC